MDYTFGNITTRSIYKHPARQVHYKPADEDWANEISDLRSLKGVFLTNRVRSIALVSTKQNSVAISTAEAGYRAMEDMMQR